MENRKKTGKLGSVLSLVVLALVGLFLIIYPGDTLNIVVGVMGGAVLLVGVIGILSYFMQKNKEDRTVLELIISIAEAIAGLIIVSNIGFVITLFPILAGVMIAVQGILNLVRALRMRSVGLEGWKLGVILSVIMIALGILVFANPFATQTALVRLAGIVLVYNAVSGMIIRRMN